ncbi:DMT family transporter [Thalassospiraceae bacterium LMO-JJ14]|nr:DMT family transporter [Thalassospiraceae bacterium LMO-JJ14]
MPETVPEAKAIHQRRPSINRPLEGTLLMIASCGFMAALSALGRHISQLDIDPPQIVFCRVLFAWMCMLPWLMQRGIGSLRTSQIKLYLFRAVVSVGAMSTWFYALALSPIGEVTALSFLAPLFTTVGAALVLGEVVRLRRWTATLIGFCGALIIIRPGFAELSPGSWFALGSAVFMGSAALIIKTLTRGDDPWTVVFFSHLIMIPLTLIPALFVWTWPSLHVWLLLAATGPIAVFGQLIMTKAFSITDVSIIAAVDFSRLPFAVLFGWLAFGELTDLWTWAGALVIFASSFYIVRREQQLQAEKNRQTAAAS